MLGCVQTDASLLTNNSQHCWMLHVASAVACCWMLLLVVAQSLKPVKLFSQQLPTFLLFRDRRSVAQQCWIRLQNSSNIVGATHAHYAWFTKTYWLYPSHDALQVPTLLGVVASVCTPLPTRTQQHCCANNVGSCCVRLHAALDTMYGRLTCATFFNTFLKIFFSCYNSVSSFFSKKCIGQEPSLLH